MIDWLTCRIPVTLPGPIKGGDTVILDAQGEFVRSTAHRLMVTGSYESRIAIRAPSTSELEISGNLAKFLQGHNLYGSTDLKGLLWASLQRIEGVQGVFPCSLRDMGLYGPESLSDGIVTRVDCTYMFGLPSPSDVLAWLRSASATGALAHRGRGVMREGTLIFGDAKGKSAARFQIVIYAKGQEVAVHRLPEIMMSEASVLDWVSKCLRTEVRLFRLELEKFGLRRLGNWSVDTALHMWRQKMSRLDFNAGQCSTALLETLPVKLRAIYLAWTTGEDLRKLYSRAMFYRHRRALLDAAGVDIAVPPPSVPTAEIVPIKRVLEAVPLGRPDWADAIDAKLAAEGATILRAA